MEVFLWTFLALVVGNMGLNYWNLKGFVLYSLPWIFLLKVLMAIIPESGPHLGFVMLFPEGIIPF